MLVLVLVLETIGTLTTPVCSRRPGGEPLWHVSGDLAIFVPVVRPAEECRSGRLPRITPARCITDGFDSFTAGP